MKAFGIVCAVIAAVIVISIGGCMVSGVSWFASRSIAVAQQQFDPAELLRKYELFKDQSAQLDAKLAGINHKKHELDRLRALPEKDRTDREQLGIQEQELGGMIYSFNALAAEYNSEMVKFNYRFCNVGELPQGASTPLPREYKQYLED